MTWNPNSAKHKATHGGYKGKPTQQQVRATLSFFSGTDLTQNKPQKKVYIQLNLFDEKFGGTK